MWFNNKTGLLSDTIRQTSQRESLAADFLRDVWWIVSRNYTVLSLSCDIKHTKFNQYLPVDLTSLDVSNSRFWKPVMFWRWRHHGVATRKRSICVLMAMLETYGVQFPVWLHCRRSLLIHLRCTRSDYDQIATCWLQSYKCRWRSDAIIDV